MKCRQIAALLVLSSSAAFQSNADAAVYPYFDTTFTNSDWVGNLHADTSSPPATFVSGQSSLNGGSPLMPPAINNGLYRETTHNYGGGAGGGIAVSHANTTFTWTPLPGEIAVAANYRYDAQYDSGTFAGAVGYDPAIFQGGNVYRYTNIDAVTKREWTRFTGTALPLSSFEMVSPVTGFAMPGFNPANNLAMTFGYMTLNSANSPAFKTHAIDNYGFQLITVPEPTSFGLIGIVGSVLGLRRRRRA